MNKIAAIVFAASFLECTSCCDVSVLPPPEEHDEHTFVTCCSDSDIGCIFSCGGPGIIEQGDVRWHDDLGQEHLCTGTSFEWSGETCKVGTACQIYANGDLYQGVCR